MSVPKRTSIALDPESERIFQELTSGGESQSNVIRRALRLYYEFRNLERKDLDRLKVYWEMLQSGEHVVLDLHHLLVLLKIAEGSESPTKWPESHKAVAANHAEQFRGMGIDQILVRLEACNFFRMSMGQEGYVLVFGSPEIKRFIRTFLEEILRGMDRRFEIKEDLTKLRLKLFP